MKSFEYLVMLLSILITGAIVAEVVGSYKEQAADLIKNNQYAVTSVSTKWRLNKAVDKLIMQRVMTAGDGIGKMTISQEGIMTATARIVMVTMIVITTMIPIDGE